MTVVRTPIRVVHLITGLDTGGAEMMLYKLLLSLGQRAIHSTVVSLLPAGDLAAAIEHTGVEVHSLDMRRGRIEPAALFRLVRLLERLDAGVLQTWMYHANLLGACAAPWLKGVPIIWNLRQSNLDPVASKRSTHVVLRLGALLSRLVPSRIVCCSQRVAEIHQRLGYPSRVMTVIPNGFDLERFRPDRRARSAFRSQCGIADSVPLIGLIARFDPQKDLETLIGAIARVKAYQPDCHLVLCGQGMAEDNPQLARLIRQAGLESSVHLMGRVRAVEKVMAALDLLVSSSAYGEGFPNVIGEAMACGVPCVVTDVGDSGLIVGDTGSTVQPRDSDALAMALVEMLNEGREGLMRRGEAARARVASEFALPQIADRYAALYRSFARQKACAEGVR